MLTVLMLGLHLHGLIQFIVIIIMVLLIPAIIIGDTTLGVLMVITTHGIHGVGVVITIILIVIMAIMEAMAIMGIITTTTIGIITITPIILKHMSLEDPDMVEHLPELQLVAQQM